MDIRHQQRIKIVQDLYASSFVNNTSQSLNKFNAKVKEINLKKEQINNLIKKFAPKFSVDKIAKIDLAILQLGIYELIFEKTEPPKVIIDEAVEIAKELGAERSFAFVNAVLGKIYEEKEK